jgi:hypothetical protein
MRNIRHAKFVKVPKGQKKHNFHIEAYSQLNLTS